MSPSIFSAGIGESGLDIYKFGPTTTVPFWSEHYKPTSFMGVLSKNMSNSEHTLVLLDIDQIKGAPMSIKQAAAIINNSNKEKVLRPDTKVLVLADIGREGQTISYTEFSKLEIPLRQTRGEDPVHYSSGCFELCGGGGGKEIHSPIATCICGF